MKKTLALCTLILGLGTAALAQLPNSEAEWHTKTRTMLEHAINTPTVIGRGKGVEMANYFANQFRAAGWAEADIHVLPYETHGEKLPSDQTAALLVRWHAAKPSKLKPIMLMGHMDVVEAKAEDWGESAPFQFTERGGYYYGRGTLDMKSGDVSLITAMLRLKAQGFAPKRDVILFITGDEETNGLGAIYGATKWHDMLDVEYGLNADGGGGGLRRDGSVIGFSFQAAEKTFANYALTVKNRGGHSSKPRPDNAIYDLAHALTNLQAYRFAPMLNETTRAYFEERQKSEHNALGDAMRAWLANEKDGAAADIIEADPAEVGLTRTRCVATMVNAGHAQNALPQLAEANVNCRIMPGISPNAVRDELEKIANDKNVVVRRLDNFESSIASPLRADILTAYTQSVRRIFPNAPVIPEMSTGASDGRFFREVGIPVYGVTAEWGVVPDDMRAHGRDERLPVAALDANVQHWMRMITALTGK
jgi:acetylornithine deacetylase/succinyl-diaminopimelate desuccinylase-like protein